MPEELLEPEYPDRFEGLCAPHSCPHCSQDLPSELAASTGAEGMVFMRSNVKVTGTLRQGAAPVSNTQLTKPTKEQK